MDVSTKKAFALFETWKSDEKPLRVVAALSQGMNPAGSFGAVVIRVHKNSDRIILLADLPEGDKAEVALDFASSLYESFEPGEIVVAGAQDWSCAIQVSLYDGGAIIFLVLR